MPITVSRRRDVRRGELSHLVVWTGSAGPVTLGEGSLGVEYRGRLGHPSSYGLLAARPMHPKAELATSFEVTPSEPGGIDPPVRGDEIVLGLADPSYAAAVRDVVSARYTGIVVTAAACGTQGSSATVFHRLALVLTELLNTDWTGVDDDVIWRQWDATPPDGTAR